MSVSVTLTRVNENIHFIGEADGMQVSIDGPPEMGGENKGMRPTHLLLCALGGCAVFDFASMLYKQGEDAIEDLVVKVDGERQQEKYAEPFVAVHIKFILTGAMKANQNMIEQTAKRAVHDLCSVGATLREKTKISFSVEIQSHE